MQNETAKHTPGPWVVVNGGTIRADGGKRPVAMCHCSAVWNTSDSAPTRFECEANADFIVRAVNSHAELLEACKAMLHAFNHCESAEEAVSYTKAAIVKATKP